VNPSAGELALALQAKERLTAADIQELRDSTDGCPACMLAALRQSGLDYHHDAEYKVLFDYREEIKTFNVEQASRIAYEEQQGAIYY
jgi:hypothetical protein